MVWKPEERITPEEALKHKFFTNNFNVKINAQEPSKKVQQKGIPEDDDVDFSAGINKSSSKLKGNSKISINPNKTLSPPLNGETTKSPVQTAKTNLKLHLNSFLKPKNQQPQLSKEATKPKMSLLHIANQLNKQSNDSKSSSICEKKEKQSEKKTLLLHVLAKKTIPIKYPGSKKS